MTGFDVTPGNESLTSVPFCYQLLDEEHRKLSLFLTQAEVAAVNFPCLIAGNEYILRIIVLALEAAHDDCNAQGLAGFFRAMKPLRARGDMETPSCREDELRHVIIRGELKRDLQVDNPLPKIEQRVIKSAMRRANKCSELARVPFELIMKERGCHENSEATGFR